MLLVILFSNSENDFGTDKFGAKFTSSFTMEKNFTYIISQWKRTPRNLES